MRTLHQTFHLQHHRHTGKLLHHQHTSYRSLVLVFIAAGLCMLGLNAINHATASALLGVSAVVEAPLPRSPAAITGPTDGTQLSDDSVLVFGSCPIVVPQVIVTVQVDGALAGSGTCDSNNDFSVPIHLTSGSHQIIAGTETISGQSGPSSDPVRVTAAISRVTPAISIIADKPFDYIGANRTVTWTGSITDGQHGTERVHVDWGDGKQSNYTVQPGPQHFGHHYTRLTSYNISLTTIDTTGDAMTEQFAAAAYTTAAPISTSTTASVDPSQTSVLDASMTTGLYGLYLTALAILGVLWLEAKHAARQRALVHAR